MPHFHRNYADDKATQTIVVGLEVKLGVYTDTLNVVSTAGFSIYIY